MRLNTLKQAGDTLTLEGVAQSNASVATYMRNLDNSPWLTRSDLQKTEAKGSDKRNRFEFGLTVKLRKLDSENAQDGSSNGGPASPSTDTSPAAAPPAKTLHRLRRPQPRRRNRRRQMRGASHEAFRFPQSGPQQYRWLAARRQNGDLLRSLFILIVLAGWYFEISDQQDELQKKQAQEEQLKKEFTEKQSKVVNLEALKAQLDEMRDMLRQLLRQLPSKTEMPELLVNISQTALSAGLETQLFKPGAEAVKEGFYAEKPIQLRMLGTYHQFGTFISGVAALPRVVILTMHDVALKPTSTKWRQTGSCHLKARSRRIVTSKKMKREWQRRQEASAAGKPGATPAKQGGK